MTNKILHITTHLGGGVGRVLLNYFEIAQRKSKYVHNIASLDYINENAIKKLDELNVDFKNNAAKNYEVLISSISLYDIIVIHWWNHPLMYEFLVKYTLPKSRVIMWSHVSGLYSPSNFTKPLFDYADRFIFTTPVSYDTKIVKGLSKTNREKLGFIWSSGGFEHLKNIKKKEHAGFNIGYVGTVDYAKLHRDFLDLSNSINIDEANFLVCGGDEEESIKKEAVLKRIDEKFHFFGKVDNVGEYLSDFDIFGYPLSPYHFGTCDQSLAEAMACGIVPVVFNNPMESNMVEHNKTGLIVSNKQEYKEAIEKLHNDKEFKNTLSKNAQEEAFKRFSLDKMVNKWEEVFCKCLLLEKSEKKWNGKYQGVCTTPLQIFIESTGELGRYFEDILFSQDIEVKNKAEKKIKKIIKLTNTWQSKTKGTLNHYLIFFKDYNLNNLNQILKS